MQNRRAMEAPADKPPQVTRAIWLLWIALLLGIATFTPDYLHLKGPNASGPPWWVWAVLVLIWMLWGVLIYLVAAGRNWARFVVLAFFVGYVFDVGSWLLNPSTMLALPLHNLIAEGMNLALSALAVFWLFTGNGATWFRRSKVAGDAL